MCERAGLSSLSGGYLLKLTLSGIQVQNADTSKLLLRPETRAVACWCQQVAWSCWSSWHQAMRS